MLYDTTYICGYFRVSEVHWGQKEKKGSQEFKAHLDREELLVQKVQKEMLEHQVSLEPQENKG